MQGGRTSSGQQLLDTLCADNFLTWIYALYVQYRENLNQELNDWRFARLCQILMDIRRGKSADAKFKVAEWLSNVGDLRLFPQVTLGASDEADIIRKVFRAKSYTLPLIISTAYRERL